MTRTVTFVAALTIGGVTSAGADGLKSLRGEPVPLPANLGDFVADQAAAIRLGKALVWDVQAGGDGAQACASCHFQAGADVRSKNQLNPGANGVFNTAPANSQLVAGNFLNNTGDVTGSQGVVKRNFIGLNLPSAVDNCAQQPDPVFGNGIRQVTGRNTPSFVNAVFNFRSFWDGRANNIFNGVNPGGPNGSQVLKVVGGVPQLVTIALSNASLASQAVGPPNNGVEMSCAGRSFPILGRKMLGLRPLGAQLVSLSDSSLGGLSRNPSLGLNTTYKALVQAAIRPEWWNSSAVVGGFTVMENNFSLYWGLSVMLYESTLVSDDSRVDRFLDGSTAALNGQEQLGLNIFDGKGRCTQCHSGAETTKATVATAEGDPLKGFINTAVRPIADDGGDILQGNGHFKTPTVRNTELNGPYFHNGEASTLRQVVEFYNRGGDFRSAFTDGQIRPIGLTEAEKAALVAFIVAYTDDRVKFERAPFDHPAIKVNNGPTLPAVGAAGRGTALATFMGLSPFAQ